ncbi:PucR family transcriptional regulator [Marmoricola sp. RAF53]|uniref:PucR family transcriptional regulator n=1 Tax=Marmoricola sp. RAF53 TaxID=3233059 RepID=UPI003F95248B
MDPSDRTALVAWVQAYVAEAGRDENVDAFVAQVDAAILEVLPELAGDPVLVADLHASTRAQFQVFLSLLEREKQELLLPPQAVDLALSIARRQLELGVLLKVYRVAGAAVWEYFTATVAQVPEDGPDRTAVLVYLWDHGGTWINEAVEALIGVFYAEREATMHGALARRTETVHALLRGEPLSADEASALLDHPVRMSQTCVVIWSEQETAADVQVRLNQTATTLAAALNAQVLTIPAGRGEVWCWCATRTSPDLASLDAALDAAATEGLGTGDVRVAVGTPGAGVDGFRAGHREAVDAQRYLVAVPARGPVVRYADVELACLVSANEPGARALVARELGRLAGAEDGLARVRETVATYLDLGASVEQTAQALFVHKNTIRYRLAQAEELIGHPLSERRTEIGLALRCVERFGVAG